MTVFLDQEIKFLPGVGPKRAEILNKELQIFTFGDLLYYYPYKYIDRTKFYKISEIREKTTYYDLMGADDYVDEFRKAMFLPHTDIELFQGVKTWQKV